MLKIVGRGKNPMKMSNQSGFSLLEVMIAVMILAVGLLGMAAMQAVALSSNQEAQFRLQALAIAEDLASRMRANRNYINVSNYDYTFLNVPTQAGYQSYIEADYNISAATPITVTGLTCVTPTDAATFNCRADADIEDIRRQMNPAQAFGRLLPAGSLLFVDCFSKSNIDYKLAVDPDTCTPGSRYTIYVFWFVSSGRVDAGQTDVDGNILNLNRRCITRLAVFGATIAAVLPPRDYGCVLLDIIP